MKISRYFIYSYAIIILLIVISSLSIYFVRSNREKRKLSIRYNTLQQEVLKRLKIASEMRATMGELKKKSEELKKRYASEEDRFITSEDGDSIEKLVIQISKETGFALKNFEKGEEVPAENYILANFTTTINGNIYNLPNFLELYFKGKRFTTIRKITAESPSFFSTKMEIKLFLTFYKRLVFKEDLIKIDEDILKNYLIDFKIDNTMDLPSKLKNMASSIEKDIQKLKTYYTDIIEFHRLKKVIESLERRLEVCESLSLEKRKNYRILMENIPNLYGRVRNSPLGMASIIIKGEEILFPDFAE